MHVARFLYETYIYARYVDIPVSVPSPFSPRSLLLPLLLLVLSPQMFNIEESDATDDDCLAGLVGVLKEKVRQRLHRAQHPALKCANTMKFYDKRETGKLAYVRREHANTQTRKHANTQTRKHANTQTRKHTHIHTTSL